MARDYVLPTSVLQALSILHTHEDTATVIGGGTMLAQSMRYRKQMDTVFVDTHDITELGFIAEQGGMITIGSAVTLAQISQSPVMQEHAPEVVQACAQLGSVQIRNVATIAGSLLARTPVANVATALAAHGALVELEDADGVHTTSLDELLSSPPVTKKKAPSLVLRVVLPVRRKGQGGAYLRMDQRKSLTYPLLNAAATVAIKNNFFTHVRIAFAPVRNSFQRAVEAEVFLLNNAVTPENVAKAGLLARQVAVGAEQDLLANAEDEQVLRAMHYRHQVLPVLVERVLFAAIADAESKAEEEHV